MTRQVSLTADGDDPFADMKAMLSAYDYDPEDVATIRVEIEVIEDTDGSEETVTVTDGTLSAWCLKILHDESSSADDPMDVSDVADHVTQYTDSGVGSSLSRLARKTPYVDRDRRSAEGGGYKHVYWITSDGRSKVAELSE